MVHLLCGRSLSSSSSSSMPVILFLFRLDSLLFLTKPLQLSSDIPPNPRLNFDIDTLHLPPCRCPDTSLHEAIGCIDANPETRPIAAPNAIQPISTGPPTILTYIIMSALI